MRLYLAGIYTANFHKGSNLYNRLTDYEKYQRDNVSYLLESFHYINKESKVNPIRNDGRKIFLDSGAFSAYTQGARINLKNYVDFIKRNMDIIEVIDGILVASVLDGIGDPLLTYQNQLAMEELGVKPLPCFHYGEDERYLEYYVSRYGYITIGGMVPISTNQLFLWLDRIWQRYLTDGSGRPKVRVHGFGLSQIDLMKRYPWYSVDLSLWVQVARVCGMLLLDGRIVSVSNVSPNRKIEWRHIDTLPPIQREAIEKRLSKCGVDLKRMRETYLSRLAYNIWAYDQLGKNLHTEDPKFTFDQMWVFQ